MKDHKQHPLSMDDVADMLVEKIGRLVPMGEETTALFQQLAKKMMKQVDVTPE